MEEHTHTHTHDLEVLETFTKDNVVYSLNERTTHREQEGGFEKWSFVIDNKTYFMSGDVRYLPHAKEKALFMDFYSEESYETGSLYLQTNTEGLKAFKIINALLYLITEYIPKRRYYRYIQFVCPPEWADLAPLLINKCVNHLGGGGESTDIIVINDCLEFLNYDLTVLVDSGFYKCYVGDLKQ